MVVGMVRRSRVQSTRRRLTQSPGSLTTTVTAWSCHQGADSAANSLHQQTSAAPLVHSGCNTSIDQDHTVPYRNSLSVTRLLSGTSSRQVGSLLGALDKGHTASLNGRESVPTGTFSFCCSCGLYANNYDHKERQCLLSYFIRYSEFSRWWLFLLNLLWST